MLTTIELEIAARGKTSRAGSDQIRHWTNLGLLPAIGNNPGSGRSRQYQKSAVAKLKVLDSLAVLGINLIGKGKFVDRVMADPKLIAAAKLLGTAVSR